MPHPTVVINVVGLSGSLIGEHSPRIRDFARAGHFARLQPVLPAVTCSVQSTMLTGVPPREHGIVGNGWYDRESAEIRFWKQTNRFVRAEKVWEAARTRDAACTCANMFWWYNMHSTADWSVTPRPIYKADGRKIPDCYSDPPELRDLLQRKLGRFPLFHFWGPASSIRSSAWIAEASMLVHERHDPTLMLIYLPHLDYALQKLGPGDPAIAGAVREIDRVVGRLIDFFAERNVRIILLSEYGIEPVHAPVRINRLLREDGDLRVREEEGLELLDAGASRAFAVADHQVAHVYVKEPGDVPRLKELCEGIDGVEHVLDRAGQATFEIDHERAGDLVLIAAEGRWFNYHYWLDDRKAPDFARTVDIHRKPGYDPLELYLDPTLTAPKLRIAWKLLAKKLGFRSLMEVIPLDPALLKGSHGRIEQPADRQPVLMTQSPFELPAQLPCAAVRDLILHHLFDDAG